MLDLLGIGDHGECTTYSIEIKRHVHDLIQRKVLYSFSFSQRQFHRLLEASRLLTFLLSVAWNSRQSKKFNFHFVLYVCLVSVISFVLVKSLSKYNACRLQTLIFFLLKKLVCQDKNL